MAGIQCGIVGLPNVGKSTLFNALTNAGIAAENYPFCTIDPNVGVAAVPDLRLQVLVDIVQPHKVVPTAMEFVDIAGLVAGASKGEGLGNQFLSHIRDVDAIAHVVRCFEDADVVHVDGRIDPLSDIAVINTELALADLATVERALDRFSRQAKSGDGDARKMATLLTRVDEHLGAGDPVRSMKLTEDERKALRQLHLLTAKPTMYIANVDEAGLSGEGDLVELVRKHAMDEGSEVVVICAAIEGEISELDDDDAAEFLADLGLEEPGLHRVIRAAYSLLGLNTFFTAGEKEVRAWTYKHGSTAPQTAGRIHTDFEKGFIRAEVISYDDYVAYNGEAGAKDAGRWRLEGKEYVVAEGDVIHFRFNL